MELFAIKVIPMLLCAICLADTLLSYFCIDVPALSYINALLVWLFLYLSSFVFKFCLYHRIFLYYLLFEGVLNWYDYTYGVPLGLRPMVCIQLSIAIVVLFIALYLHQHGKHPRKEDCC